MQGVFERDWTNPFHAKRILKPSIYHLEAVLNSRNLYLMVIPGSDPSLFLPMPYLLCISEVSLGSQTS